MIARGFGSSRRVLDRDLEALQEAVREALDGPDAEVAREAERLLKSARLALLAPGPGGDAPARRSVRRYLDKAWYALEGESHEES